MFGDEGKRMYLCTENNKRKDKKMIATTVTPPSTQMIITLEDNAVVADIKKALKLIRGIASVRTATVNDDRSITPALRRSMKKAREEYAKGETISCHTPEEMQKYFDSL